MARVIWLIILALSSCSPSSPPSDAASRETWVTDRLKRVLDPLDYLPRESEKECADRLSAGFDRFLGEALQRYPDPPVDEIRRALARSGNMPPFIQLLACDPIPGSRDLLIPYVVALSATSGSTRLRLARRVDGKCHLVRPSGPEIREAERELACWKGGDLHARYGPPYHPDPLTLEECCCDGGPVFLPPRGAKTLFALGYGISSTCPSTFEVVWSYEAGNLLPAGYAWGESATKGWRPFGATPLGRLQDEIVREMTYEGK